MFARQKARSDNLFDFDFHPPAAAKYDRQYKIMRAAYLAAISLATVGWLWLMVWLSSYLI